MNDQDWMQKYLQEMAEGQKYEPGQARDEAGRFAGGGGSYNPDDYQITISMRTPVAAGGFMPTATPQLAKRAAPDARKRGVDITIDGEPVPDWAKNFAVHEVETNKFVNPVSIGERIAKALDLDKNGRELVSKFPGKDALTGDQIKVGENILYTKRSGSTRRASLNAMKES